ncbi:MAG: hypothetical protein H8D43_04585 [Chloroflexi bacterium]|nr:hypothetical protein [Chloroflexota bacterium]
MNKYTQIRQRLAAIAKSLADEKRDLLEKFKAEYHQLERSDFVWHYLLQSFATMGNARGWDGLIGNGDNYEKVTFDALAQLSPLYRRSVLEQTLRDAKVRMPVKKAEWLARNFDRIVEMGGLAEVKAALLSKSGREDKIRFLKSFVGIGDKYSRNIMMDVYHPDFRESIAIDARITSLSNELGLSFDGYEEHEQFYLDVAHEAGLSGWELDRLIFNFREEIIFRLHQAA